MSLWIELSRRPIFRALCLSYAHISRAICLQTPRAPCFRTPCAPGVPRPPTRSIGKRKNTVIARIRLSKTPFLVPLSLVPTLLAPPAQLEKTPPELIVQLLQGGSLCLELHQAQEKQRVKKLVAVTATSTLVTENCTEAVPL